MIAKIFIPAWRLERLVLPVYRSITGTHPISVFGSVGNGITYIGKYTEELARNDLASFFGDTLPPEAGNFSGTYNCRYYDDFVDEKIKFSLPPEAWNKWLPDLRESMQRFGRHDRFDDRSEENSHSLYADYNQDNGTLSVVFDRDERMVEVERYLND